MGYRITAAAKADLLDTGRFTQQRWGTAQRRKYLAQLQSAFHRISKHPHLGTPCPEIRVGYLQIAVGRHRIFYRLGEDGNIEIIRVLHQSKSVDPLLARR